MRFKYFYIYSILIVLLFSNITFAETSNPSVKSLQKACDGGDAAGCTQLGFLYLEGKGVKKDYLKAVKLYQKGCDGGNAVGCMLLGFMYEKDKGVKQNDLRALKYYKKAVKLLKKEM